MSKLKEALEELNRALDIYLQASSAMNKALGALAEAIRSEVTTIPPRDGRQN